jgi:hypothetical protein
MGKSKMSFISRLGLIVVFLFVLPVFAFAQQPDYGFLKGDKTFTLSGAGSSDNDFDNTVFTTSFSLGYFFTDNFEGSLRQDVSFVDAPGDNLWNGATQLVVDYHFDLARFQPLLGASIGYLYGDNVKDQFIAGPEAGVKWFINQTTYITALVQYQFLLDDDDGIDDNFDDGRFVYGLGIGVRF